MQIDLKAPYYLYKYSSFVFPSVLQLCASVIKK